MMKLMKKYECTMCDAYFVVWMFFSGIYFWFYLTRLGMEMETQCQNGTLLV